MAFGFFRRRQKMVIIIMVALMVSFLVGWQGVSLFLTPKPEKQKIGETRAGTILRGELMSAAADLDILSAMGFGNRYRYPPWPTEMAYIYLQQTNGENARFAYTLLISEAREAGVLVNEGDVDAFFAGIGLTGDRYAERISSIRSRNSSWTERHIRGAIATWLLVHKHFVDSSVGCAPSETEVRVAYRDLTEQIDLRVLRLKAEDFLEGIPDPNQTETDAHFNMYRPRFEGQTRKVDDFGFGYRQPGRAKIQYLFVRGDVVRRVTEPDFREVMDYYNRNKAEFTKEVPAGAATTQPPGGASQPADVPTKTVQKSFAEAKAEIVERLREVAVAGRLDSVTGAAEAEVKRLLGSRVDPAEAYDRVRASRTRPAEKVLAAALQDVKIDNVALDEAVEKLAEAAGLAGICYPWGTHGENTLLPSVKVTVRADRITLGEALAEISKQAKWPKLHWARCDGFRDVLFSVAAGSEGVDFFPLQVGQIPLSTAKEIVDHDVLGFAYTSQRGGNNIAQIAFTAEGLSPRPGREGVIQVGEQGSRMYVSGDRTGRLLWRLVEISAAHVPTDLNDRPDLREKVVEDLKITRAFLKALEKGKKTVTASKGIGLARVAEFQKLETFTTGLFARKSFVRGFSMVPQVAVTNVPNLDLDTRQLRAAVINAAFKLTPKNVEPSALSAAPEALDVIPLKIRKEVLVVERAGYKPVVRPEYEQSGRLQTAWFLVSRRKESLDVDWFSAQSIAKRVNWVPYRQR